MRKIKRRLAVTAAAGLVGAAIYSSTPESPFIHEFPPDPEKVSTPACERKFAESILVSPDTPNAEAFRSSMVAPVDQELQQQICERAHQIARFLSLAYNQQGHPSLEDGVRVFSSDRQDPSTRIITAQKEDSSQSQAAVATLAISFPYGASDLPPTLTPSSVLLSNKTQRGITFRSEFYSTDTPNGTRWIAEQTQSVGDDGVCLDMNSSEGAYSRYSSPSLSWCSSGQAVDGAVRVEEDLVGLGVVTRFAIHHSPFGIPTPPYYNSYTADRLVQ